MQTLAWSLKEPKPEIKELTDGKIYLSPADGT
jgi:hypothetical protein